MYKRVVETLKSKGLTVTFAESCTGGYLAKSVTDIPGASEVFKGSAVTYCDEMKHKLLGVSLKTLGKYTAVSAPAAYEMARGARELFGADISVSVTGYAGPGGTPGQPAGLVYVGVATEMGITVRRLRIGSGEYSRDQIRAAVVKLAAGYILQAAEEYK